MVRRTPLWCTVKESWRYGTLVAPSCRKIQSIIVTWYSYCSRPCKIQDLAVSVKVCQCSLHALPDHIPDVD